MNFLIAGDSHTGPLSRGLKALRETGALDPAMQIRVRPIGGGHLVNTPFWELRGDHVALTEPAYQKVLRRLPPPRQQLTGIGLSMPFWSVRVLYRMVVAQLSLVEPVGDLQPVSRAAFRQILRHDQQYVLGFAESLAKCGVTVFAVAAPRLFRDNSVLSRIAPEMAMAICNEYFAFMRDELGARGVDIIDVPPETLDAEGFTLPEYRSALPGDDHHANEAFGKLMIKRVEDWARVRFA